MKLHSLVIKNIKSFNDKEIINFHKDYSVIVGPNGSGKSNILDIINITLRRYFIYSYRINPYNETNGYSEDLQKENIFADFSTKLEKFRGNDGDRELTISFIVTQEDIVNIRNTLNHYNELKEACKKYRNNPTHLIECVAGWDATLFEAGDKIDYVIKEATMINTVRSIIDGIDKKEKQFVEYLNVIELLSILGEEITEYKYYFNYLFFSPYRNSNVSNLQSQLSNESFSNHFLSAVHTTTKEYTSFFKLASFYFADKKRSLEINAFNEGYIGKWNEDPEVKLLTKYLSKMGYSWEVENVNSSTNLYSIQLYKSGEKFELDKASSGEKEILNFILGIFTMNLKDGLVIIDEPELHLHPRWQKLLIELLVDLSENTKNQLILCTHSPIFIDSLTYSHILRISKNDMNTSKVTYVKDDTTLKDIMHIINSTNNEKLFFADRVILVEGVTDYIIFNKIIDSLKVNVNYILEVIDIKGKTNKEKYFKFMEQIGVKSYFITDLDYLNNIENETIKQLFTCNSNKIGKDVIKNNKSKDMNSLFSEMEKTIKTENFDQLKELWEYIKSIRTKLREDLTSDEFNTLNEFISEQEKVMTYVLSRGDIEDYFPIGYKVKDLNNVFKLIEDDNFNEWKETHNYKELENIIKKIIV